jgi:hypothetical protein
MLLSGLRFFPTGSFGVIHEHVFEMSSSPNVEAVDLVIVGAGKLRVGAASFNAMN